MRKRDLILFFLITFFLTWGIVALYMLAPNMMVGLFGKLTGSHPLFFLAVWGPAISALIMVLFRHGFAGVRHFLSRMLLWRASLNWYAFIFILVPLVFYAASLFIDGAYNTLFPFESVQAYITALLLMGLKGPIEEIGWRGLALPLLQRRMSPFWSAIIIGVIWAIWHTPAFLLSVAVYSAWSFAPFFFGTVALSIIMTALFNSSRGSILLPALLHWQLINPLWPDVQPYDNWIMIIIAIAIVWINRDTMFSSKNSIKEVFPNEKDTISSMPCYSGSMR
ncbi:CPBP family intramembrane metalloprotease [Candidatus Desantisbacteria bacterium]|nr:CPBP family intramembrane metalloprotease [Candidatus Desantisbacteria bacterium]